MAKNDSDPLHSMLREMQTCRTLAQKLAELKETHQGMAEAYTLPHFIDTVRNHPALTNGDFMQVIAAFQGVVQKAAEITGPLNYPATAEVHAALAQYFTAQSELCRQAAAIVEDLVPGASTGAGSVKLPPSTPKGL